MKSTYFFFLLLIGLFGFAQKATQKIGVVYYNQVDADLKKQLLSNIKATYNCTVVEILGSRALPAAAYYKARNRYRATGLLDDLNTIKGYDKVIGVTSKDISTTLGPRYDWGVMGLARNPGKPCVISTFRIKTPDKAKFNDRFIKVALHELGHTMGIPHCKLSKTCFMQAAEATVKTVDRETRNMCTNCKKILNR